MENKDLLVAAAVFVENLLTLECQALDAYREPEAERYNTLYEQLSKHSACDAIRFHLAPRQGPLSDFERQMYALVPAANRVRHLFFLELFPHPDWGKVVAVYCSSQNPPEKTLLLGERWWLKQEKETFKVIAYDKVDDLDLKEPILTTAAGIPAFKMSDLGELLASLHLLAPVGDSFGMALYQAKL